MKHDGPPDMSQEIQYENEFPCYFVLFLMLHLENMTTHVAYDVFLLD